MPVVLANGLAFHTQLLGTAGRPALAMLHGLVVGSLAEWYFGPAPRLAKDYQVLLYDLRGHGRSEIAASGYYVATQAGDLAALLGGFTDAPVTLVGHSWGALIALRFALDHPGRVRRLVLVEAPLPPAAVPELEAILADPASALPAPLADAARAGQRRGRKLVSAVARLAFETTLIADVRREPDIPDSVLSGLRVPTLLVYGRTSGCRPAGERLARTLPDSELVLVDAGHFVTSEARGALADLLEERLCPR